MDMAPQGAIGGFLGGLAGRGIGHLVGGRTGGRIGQTLGGIAGSFLPFQAGPGAPVQYVPAEQVAAYDPQGIHWGTMIRNVGAAVGDTVGGRTGNIIRDVSGLGQYLPFQAYPGAPVEYVPVAQTEAEAFAPQGVFGRALGGLAGRGIGHLVGGRRGGQVGQALGGALGNLLPFQAYPGAPVEYVQAPDSGIVYH